MKPEIPPVADPREILDQGFVLVRQAIGSEQLEPLRERAELFLQRAHAQTPGDPNIGWDNHRVPHPGLHDLIDGDTNSLFDALLAAPLLAVNCQLMGAESVGLNSASLFIEPARKLKKRFQFHRDFNPTASLPLCGLQADCQANAPGHLTWNFALYDDASLWVVAGSNKRANSATEQQVLDQPDKLADAPLPGAVPVELAAGDAVAFAATMLHSGSNDSATYRRTFNASYRAFGGPVFPHNRTTSWQPDIRARLLPYSAGQFSRFELLLERERATLEATLRSIIHRDESAFRQHLARLHPGASGRMACIVQLDKVAYALWTLSNRNPAALSNAEYGRLTLDHASNRWRTNLLLERFSGGEVQKLWRHFSTLDGALKNASEPVGGFTMHPSAYDCIAMPQQFGVDEFISSWTQC